jgi:ribonuclease R
MRALGMEFFKHDEKRHALIGDRTGTTYNLGAAITVRLAEAAPITGGLRFELAEQEGWSQGPRARRPGKRPARRR